MEPSKTPVRTPTRRPSTVRMLAPVPAAHLPPAAADIAEGAVLPTIEDPHDAQLAIVGSVWVLAPAREGTAPVKVWLAPGTYAAA